MLLKHLLLWFPMIAIAFANAAVREIIFLRYFNELRAHQISTVLLIALCSIYVWLVTPILKIQNLKQASFVGLMWVIYTILFEFTLGRLTNKPWDVLLQDYNILAGKLWPLFLLCLFLMPCIFYPLRSK